MAVGKNQKAGDQSGFTLIELLIAVLVITAGMMAAVTMQGIALNSNTVANRVSIASFIAQEVAEDISSRNITDPILIQPWTGVTYQPIDWSSGQYDPSFSITSAGTFSAIYTITPNTTYNGTLTGSTQIQVTVTYVNPKTSLTSNATYTTYKMVL